MRNGDLFWDHQNAVYQRRSHYSRNSERRTAEVGGCVGYTAGVEGFCPQNSQAGFMLCPWQVKLEFCLST